MEVINRKENKEVATICLEVRIPMKKPKIYMEFFHVSFQKQLSRFGFDTTWTCVTCGTFNVNNTQPTTLDLYNLGKH